MSINITAHRVRLTGIGARQFPSFKAITLYVSSPTETNEWDFYHQGVSIPIGVPSGSKVVERDGEAFLELTYEEAE